MRSRMVPVLAWAFMEVNLYAREWGAIVSNDAATSKPGGERQGMRYKAKYAVLLEAIANEADTMAMEYFRSDALGTERKRDGSVVTVADKTIEQMAIGKVKASGLPIDVLGEETSGEIPKGPATNGRARMIIDPIDGTEEFTRGIPTFGTLIGVEEDGEIVAGIVSAPALARGARWYAYRGEGAYRSGKRIHVSSRKSLAEAMVFITGTGPRKDPEARVRLRRLADSARSSRAMGGFWQHM